MTRCSVRYPSTIRLTTVLFLLLVGNSSIDAGKPQQPTPAPQYDWHFEEVDSSLRERRDRILAEIETGTGGEWAGQYVGDGGETSASVLIWAPRSGYLLYFAPDAPTIEHVSYGTVLVSGGRLRLLAERPIEKLPLNAFAAEFQCVRWGKSRYLVPPDRLTKFCAAVSSRDFFETIAFLGKGRSEVAFPRDWPDVPQPYRKHLRVKPIIARVVGMRNAPEAELRDPTVILGSGSAHGLVDGMKLWVYRPRGAGMGLRVTTVRTHSAEATIEDAIVMVDGSTEKAPKLRKGWTFRNRRPKDE